MSENLFFKWLIIISIVIVGNMFFNYSISILFEKPEFDKICATDKIIDINKDQDSCIMSQGKWVREFYEGTQRVVAYCNNFENCSMTYDKEIKVFEQKVFFTLIVAGVIVMMASFLITSHTYSLAFGITAFTNFIFASIRYWDYSNDLTRLAILFVSLLVLVFLFITRYIQKKKYEEIQSQRYREQMEGVVGRQ